MTYRKIQAPAEVREVLGRPTDFLPSNALTAVVPLSRPALRRLHEAKFALPPVLASAVGVPHQEVRRVVTRYFTPASVTAMGPRIVDATARRVEQANQQLRDGPVDLVSTIADPVPLAILQHLTGIACPTQLKIWSRDSLELFWGSPTPDRQLYLADSAAHFYTWLRSRVEADRESLNLFGALARLGLEVEEICSLGYFLLIAGHETTAQLASTGFLRALQRPGVWQTLHDEATARQFVRDILATESSVPTWRRVAARDTTVGDTAIPAGTEVLLSLTGQHPDDADPHAYGLAFGYGIHRCVGAKLAELEATLMVQTTARHLDPVRLLEPQPDWLRLLSFAAPLTVRVGSS